MSAAALGLLMTLGFAANARAAEAKESAGSVRTGTPVSITATRA
jgi:hypothetical protein